MSGDNLVKKRVESIFNILKEPLDLILIKTSTFPFIDNNFFYFTGLKKGIFENSIVALYPDGNLDIIVSKLEEESAKKSKANLHVYKDLKDWNIIIEDLFLSCKNIGLNYNGITHSDLIKFKKIFTKSKFFDISEQINHIRLVKDKYEIDAIKKACLIVDKVVEKIPELLHEGILEYEIAAEINHLMQQFGAEKPAFETISSFGVNTAEPHYTHGNNRLYNGNFALFDFGASLNKYNSDITRTFIFKNSNNKQKEMYDTVIKAQKLGLDLIKPNQKAKIVHDSVYSFIEKTKFKGYFIHSTGHSLGLEVHDGGSLGPDSNLILKENMVFTVEPGIYIPGFGGVRIEDDVRITKDGFELLTNSSKEFYEF